MYAEYIKSLPKVANGRFSEIPTFIEVLYIGLIFAAVMAIMFFFYVRYKRNILKKRVLSALGVGKQASIEMV